MPVLQGFLGCHQVPAFLGLRLPPPPPAPTGVAAAALALLPPVLVQSCDRRSVQLLTLPVPGTVLGAVEQQCVRHTENSGSTSLLLNTSLALRATAGFRMRAPLPGRGWWLKRWGVILPGSQCDPLPPPG